MGRRSWFSRDRYSVRDSPLIDPSAAPPPGQSQTACREAIAMPVAGPNFVRAPSRKRYDYLVVGAGFAGSVAAERLASQHDAQVLVIDRRRHLPGSAGDEAGDSGTLVGSGEALAYLSQFAVWRPSAPARAGTGERRRVDRREVVPLDGYAALFSRMLDHPNIDVLLATDYRDIMGEVEAGHIVFSGPTDEYFTYRCDRPSDRSPAPGGDPHHPTPRPEDPILFKRYQALADANPNVTFVGRLAACLGCTMDQMVARALAAFRRLDAERAALFAQSRGGAGSWIEAAE
jgi:UDP-galactopyranose mutase